MTVFVLSLLRKLPEYPEEINQSTWSADIHNTYRLRYKTRITEVRVECVTSKTTESRFVFISLYTCVWLYIATLSSDIDLRRN